MDTPFQVRDILQARLLAALFRNASRNELVLNGGMALRVLYKSTRYTKDINLAHDANRTLVSLQNHVRRALREVERANLLVKCQVSEAQQTNTLARWKINGQAQDGAPIFLTIEVSRRGEIVERHIQSVPFAPPPHYGVPQVMVDIYDGSTLAADKVAALLDPQRVACRDLYDLHEILTHDVRPDARLITRLDLDSGEAVSRLNAKLKLMTWDRFKTDVVPTLEPYTAQHFDKPLYDTMRARVAEALALYLKESLRMSESSA